MADATAAAVKTATKTMAERQVAAAKDGGSAVMLLRLIMENPSLHWDNICFHEAATSTGTLGLNTRTKLASRPESIATAAWTLYKWARI